MSAITLNVMMLIVWGDYALPGSDPIRGHRCTRQMKC